MYRTPFIVTAILLLQACSHEPVAPDIRSLEPFVFAVIGDYGDAGEPALNVAQLVKSWNPEFILTTGDNNYWHGNRITLNENIGQYYCDFIYNPDAPEEFRCHGKASEEGQNRFFPSLGNHDFYSPEDHKPYLDYFTLPGNEEFYDFSWGPLHLFALNSGELGDADCCDTEQSRWLKTQLAYSKAPIRLVFFHHPPYSAGRHGNTSAMQWPFAKWGATAVLSGHNHLYHRIHPKKPGEIPYFVNGLGGKSTIYHCSDHPLDSNEFEDFCYNKDFGAMRVTVQSDEVIFQFFSVGQPKVPIDTHRIRYAY